jgi:sugar lactone lactonase YvrE
MRSILFFLIVALLSIQTAIAQSVGIGTNNPNPSARLEVNSTTQGLLIPTLTAAQRSAISNPATGLLVFQTDGTPGFYYYTSVTWLSLATGHQPTSTGVSSNYGLTTTLAGNGSTGTVDGIGTAATFNGPLGIAVDASGNLYVADVGGQKIRKVTANGVVSSLAGSGTRGFADGTGTAAFFNDPTGVAVDASGNVYIADRGSHRIRKIIPLPNGTGVVSTLAGSGTSGFVDNTGTAAYFNTPSGVAVDASGNVYVSDRFNHAIRKITPAGVVSTLAGNGTAGYADGTGAAALFNNPYGMAIDASGNLYVADLVSHRIRKITPAGVVSTLAGSGSPGAVDGIGTAASFDQPIGVAVDVFGNVYVSEVINTKIRKITSAGVVSTLAGNGPIPGFADGIGAAASFNRPAGLTVDISGNVYVGDTNNERIRKIIAY